MRPPATPPAFDAAPPRARSTPALLARARASLATRATSHAWRAYERAKPILNGVAGARAHGHVFILGCQRSGTTLLERLYRADPRSAVFGEFSELSWAPDHTAWRPLPEVVRHLSERAATYTVSRSLLASHRAREILDATPNSVAIWLYRPPDPVVRSMLRKWGGEFRAISERVETRADGVWELRALWERLEREAGRPADLYRLYWLSRNRAYFDQRLERDGRVLLVDYDSLCRAPGKTVSAALGRIGLTPPRIAFPVPARAPAPAGARFATPSDDIDARCAALLARLDAAARGDDR